MIEYLFQFKVFDIENTIKEEKALTQLLRKSPYLVRIQENTDQKKLRIWTLFRLCVLVLLYFLERVKVTQK